MRSIVLYAPHLGRDFSALRAALPTDLDVIVGPQTERGEDGCLENHKRAIRLAILKDEDRIFVLEDDCQFTQHFDYDRWCADADWAEAQGYDVMAGGSTRTYDEKVVRSDACRRCGATSASHPVLATSNGAGGDLDDGCLSFAPWPNSMIEVEAFHSAHCVVYFKSGYEKALRAVQPYDMSLGRDCKMRCVLVHPFVAVQRPCYSGILKQQVDYVPQYGGHELELRHSLGLTT